MSNDYVHMIGQLEMNHVVNVVAINKFIQTKEGEEWNVQQMVVQYDSECKTKTWLDCKTELEAGYKIVTKLKCRVSVCVRVCVCVCVCVWSIVTELLVGETLVTNAGRPGGISG